MARKESETHWMICKAGVVGLENPRSAQRKQAAMNLASDKRVKDYIRLATNYFAEGYGFLRVEYCEADLDKATAVLIKDGAIFKFDLPEGTLQAFEMKKFISDYETDKRREAKREAKTEKILKEAKETELKKVEKLNELDQLIEDLKAKRAQMATEVRPELVFG